MASIIPLALAVLGAVIPGIGSGFSNSGLAALWVAVMAIVLVVPSALRLDRPARVFIGFVALVATLVVFAPEGGWWFVPAVLSRLILDIRSTPAQLAAEGSTLRGADR